MKGFDNDERYSHSPEKMNIATLHDLFLDNYAVAEYLWKHKDFLSISSSNNLEEAAELGETMGYEDGFLPRALDVIDSATDRIFDLTSLVNPNEEITLYRGIELTGDAEPDSDHPGICWTFDKETAINFVNQFDDDDPNNAPCILTGKTKISNVDWLVSLLLNADEPDEKEIRIWDDSKIEIIDTEVL